MSGIFAPLKKGLARLQGESELVPAALFQPRAGLPNVLAKLRGGQEVRVAYLGGSITSAAGWRPKSAERLRRDFPGANVIEIHAAIPGTGSELGVHRLRQDVLRHRPDLIFVEFSVNDFNVTTGIIYQCMEGIVRQVWNADPNTDICFVYTFRPDYVENLRKGLCSLPPSVHEIVAEHYGIPSVNLALQISQLEQAGQLTFQAPSAEAGKVLFSHDGIHPLDAGHEIYADTLAEVIKSLPEGEPHPHPLPPPLNADNREQAQFLPPSAAQLSSDWVRQGDDSKEAQEFGRFMPEIWKATTPGVTFSFQFKGTTAYLYDIIAQDGGQIVITLDGVQSKPVARFDKFASWRRISTVKIGDGLADAVHSVKVELLPEQPDRSIVTDVEQHKPDFDPSIYDGTVLRIGGILLVGELLNNG